MDIKKHLRAVMLGLCLVCAQPILLGCDDDAAEEAGEKIDDAVEDAKDKLD
jgi:hypothetical protein